MAVTYDHTANTVTCTGAGNTFGGLYTADKAGTYELVHARNIVAADGANVVVSHAEKPTDYYVLGLADIYITITNFTANGSILITGTEEYGAAQTETIPFTANGVYNSTKYWRTITHTRVTVYANTFTYTLTQGQWGTMWKIGLNTFKLDCNIYIGDGATATALLSTSETIVFDCVNKAQTYTFYITAAASFTLGVLTAGIGEQGSNVVWDSPKNYCYCDNYGTLRVYNSRIMEYNPQAAGGSVLWRQFNSATFTSVDSSYFWLRYPFAATGTCTISSTRDQVNNPYEYFYASVVPTSVTLTAPVYLNGADGTGYGLEFSGFGITTVTVNGALVLTAAVLPSRDIYMNTCAGTTVNLINCQILTWTILWTGSDANARIYRQYTMDVKVSDKDDVAINGATVAVVDVSSNAVFSVNTGADGRIAQQTFSRGYYKSATVSVLQEYAPHTLTITAAGYQTYVKKFTATEAIDWEIKLAKQRPILFQQGNPVLNLTPKDPESQNVLAL